MPIQLVVEPNDLDPADFLIGPTFIECRPQPAGEFHFFESAGVNVNATTAWQDKINQTTGVLVAGDYRLLVSYGWNYNATTQDFESRVLIGGVVADGGGAGILHKQEPKDSAGNHSGTGSNQRFGYTRALYFTLAAAGPLTLQLQWRSSINGTNASIWGATFDLVRVA